MTANRPPVREADIEARLLEFMQRELLSAGVTVTPEDNLLSGTLIDSIGMLRLANFVQDEFRVVMRPQDFVIENFRSVAALTAFVRRATTMAGPPRAG